MSNYYKSDSDGNIHSGGASFEYVETLTASKTLDIEDHDKIFFIATDALTMTLPAVAAATAPKGMKVTFVNTGADGNNIITISPNASDAIYGSCAASAGGNADATTADGLVSKASGTDDKDWVNTKATANKGDRVTLVSDGSTGWFIVEGVGIWASEA